jgi:hypothetical protein
MSKVKWTTSPYNENVYKNSLHRIMFMALEPNGDKKLGVTDMGEWLREEVEPGAFLDRINIITNGILSGINLDKPMNHIKLVDWKATPGKGEANDMKVYENYVSNNITEVSSYFSGDDYPFYVIFLGDKSKKLFIKFKDKLPLNEKTKAVFMPQASPAYGLNLDALKSAMKKLSLVTLKEDSNKFQSITSDFLFYWRYKKPNWLEYQKDVESNWEKVAI